MSIGGEKMNRDDFPILKSGVIYFDSGATALKSAVLVDFERSASNTTTLSFIFELFVINVSRRAKIVHFCFLSLHVVYFHYIIPTFAHI